MNCNYFSPYNAICFKLMTLSIHAGFEPHTCTFGTVYLYIWYGFTCTFGTVDNFFANYTKNTI